MTKLMKILRTVQNTIKKNLLPLSSLVALVVLWQGLALIAADEHIFPKPSTVLTSLYEMLKDGSIIKHAVASLFRVTAGFYLSIIIGLPVGVMLGWWRASNVMLNPVIQFLRPISPLAWIPLAMVWFGIGELPAVFLIFLASVFPLIVSTVAAVHKIRPTYFYVAANFNFSKSEVVMKIIIPGILPAVLTALRISVGIAWLVVVAAEMIAVKSGLGYLILDSRNGLQMDRVIAAMIFIGAIGLVLDFIMSKLGKMESVSWSFS
jgi:NitT/TauT family transport system permease protein